MFSGFHRNDSNYSSVVLECVVVLCWSYNVLHFGRSHFTEMNKKLVSQHNSYLFSPCVSCQTASLDYSVKLENIFSHICKLLGSTLTGHVTCDVYPGIPVQNTGSGVKYR